MQTNNEPVECRALEKVDPFTQFFDAFVNAVSRANSIPKEILLKEFRVNKKASGAQRGLDRYRQMWNLL